MFLINPYIFQASGNPLWDGLLAYYTADNTPNDALGTYNGTLTNGATYGTGIINNGFSFDGVNDYISISPTFGSTFSNNASPHSYAAWIYPTNITDTYNFIIQNGSGAKGTSMLISTSKLSFFFGGGSNVTSTAGGVINVNQWNHVVCAYDGAGVVKFYVDGSLITTGAASWTDAAGATNTYIGSYAGATHYFNGIIDEVGVWNRELIASEVTELYNSGAGKQYPTGILPLWNDLLAYYTADNTPNDALDTYNGTLVNGTTYGTGIINQGFSLDGVNDTVDFGNVLDFDGSTPFSISCWINGSSLGSTTKIFLAKCSNTTPFNGYTFGVTSAKNVYFQLSNDANTNFLAIINTATLSDSTWYHCLMTYDGSKSSSGLKVYVDNALNTQTIFSDTLTGSISNTKSFKIGARDNGFFYGGLVDEISVFNRELTASEVTQLYNGGAGLQY